MTTSPNRTYLPQLDQLRGAACLLVFAYHGFQLVGAQLAHGVPFNPTRHWVIARNPLVAVIEEGHSAVGLFIVLSGFVLSLGAIGRLVAYGRFLQARALRIYPVLVLCVATAAVAHAPSLTSLAATLLPFRTSDAMVGPATAMVWAVGVEFLCYIMFPFLIRFSGDKNGSRFLLQVVGLTVTMRALAVFGDAGNPRDISYWTVLGRLDQFCIGMIAGRLYILEGWRERLPVWSVLPAGAAVVIMLWLFNQAGGWPVISAWKLLWPTVEAGCWAVFLLSYLRASHFVPHAIAAPLTWLGVVSYPLYMLHFAVLTGCIEHGAILHLTGQPYPDALLTTGLVALPIALGVAVLVHLTVELPFLQMRPRYILPRMIIHEARTHTPSISPGPQS